MNVIKKAVAGQQQKPLSVEELVDGIAKSLEQTNGVVSIDRLESVDSHLRTAIQSLGYKPTESRDSGGKIITTVKDLLKQLIACISDTDEIAEDQHAHILLHLQATHSNCAAEVGRKTSPQLKEIPLKPSSSAPQQQQQQQNSNPEGNKLMELKFQDLLKVVEEFNADPAHVDKITVPNNASKLVVANLILKAKGLPAL